MKIQPLKDLLLIKLDERKNTTAAGIYIKEAWESAINSGEILEVGPEATVKKGTRVIINPYALLECGMKETFLIKEADIVGFINE